MELHKYTVYLGLTGSLFGYVKHPIFRRIEELGKLQNGLPFGSGTAPSAGTLAIATQVASKAMSLGFSELDAFPGRNGEVTIAIYLGELDHSFQVRPDLSLRYLKESDPDSDVEAGLSLTDVTQKITDIAQAHPLIELVFWDSRNRYFRSKALENSSDDGGISVVDVDCIRRGECRCICGHARKFYRTVSSEPPIFWQFDESALPDGCGYCFNRFLRARFA